MLSLNNCSTLVRTPFITKPVIDLATSDGNIYAFMIFTRDIGKKVGLTKQQVEAIQTDMLVSTYEHALRVFKKHFGAFVTLKNEKV